MNIRMALLTSAAAFAAASTPVFAADAIVAAEPEPVEYVRVCDAYGTGYFYIPGTETCLKVSGYIRFEVYGGPDEKGTSDWNACTRAQVQFTAKSDTEYGPLTGVIVFRNNGDNSLDRHHSGLGIHRHRRLRALVCSTAGGMTTFRASRTSCPASRRCTTPSATSTKPAISTPASA